MTPRLRVFLMPCALPLLLGPSLLAQAPAQRTFDPFPAGSAARYHFDLDRNFFPSPAYEAERRRSLTRRLEQFRQLTNRLPRTAEGLLTALRLQDSLDLEASRHTSYLDLRFNADTQNADAERAAEGLSLAADQTFAAFDSALASVPDSVFRRLERAQAELRRYGFAVEKARRTARHRLTPEGERALAALGPMATGGGAQLFRATLNATDFGFVQTPAGRLSVARDYTAIASNPDPRVRREGYLRNEDGLSRRRQVYADILVRTATALNAAARLRGYANYAEESYSGRFLDRAQVIALLDALARVADINKRIEHTVIDHLRTSFALDTVHVWDLSVPEPGIAVPRFTIAEASRLVQEAARPLGEPYARELAALLDPANGRLDIAPGPHRANRQGFSNGLVGFPSMFFQGSFGGYVEDVVTLAHESGHAVQNMLMTSNRVLPRYASGPGYFTESFAGLSELMLLDHLYRTAPDRAHKIYYLQRLIGQGADVFRTGWESLVEQDLFDSTAAGRSLSADDIEALTQRTGSRFSTWLGPGSEWKLAWLQPTQFFTRPLYRINYVYSKLLALRYFDLLRTRREQFTQRYLALLSNGYDAPPDTLLQRFVDTRLDDPMLIDGAVGVLTGWLADLEMLYRS